MSSVERRSRDGRLVWRAHYRTPDGKQRNRTFIRKVDAERFLTTVEGSKLTGSYVDPAMSRLTIAAWSDRWLEGQTHLRASTRERYAGVLRRHVVPRWGMTRLSDVTHSGVQAWISDLSQSHAPATVRKVHTVLSLVLSLAVKDGRLVRNPADGVNLPRVTRGERLYLTHGQVQDVADAAGAYRLTVLMLAYTGLRFGELAALRVGKLDLFRRRAAITQSVTEVNGQLDWGPPKGHAHRDVPIPRFLIDELAVNVAGKAADALAFPGVTGVPLRVRVFRRPFDRAVASAGLPKMHPHELRHTSASLAIGSGANVKVVQQMLGHASAVMTLDLYGHLFPDQLDEVADRMDAAARESAVARALPKTRLLDLGQLGQSTAAQ